MATSLPDLSRRIRSPSDCRVTDVLPSPTFWRRCRSYDIDPSSTQRHVLYKLQFLSIQEFGPHGRPALSCWPSWIWAIHPFLLFYTEINTTTTSTVLLNRRFNHLWWDSTHTSIRIASNQGYKRGAVIRRTGPGGEELHCRRRATYVFDEGLAGCVQHGKLLYRFEISMVIGAGSRGGGGGGRGSSCLDPPPPPKIYFGGVAAKWVFAPHVPPDKIN